jgi:hypothetical protein
MLPEKQRRKVNSTIKSNPPLHHNSSERAWIGAGTLPSTKALERWHKQSKHGDDAPKFRMGMRSPTIIILETFRLKEKVKNGERIPNKTSPRIFA